jgi:hypothetical protein
MNNLKCYLLSMTLLLLLFSCKKSETLKDDPYAGGKAALGIKVSNVAPKPASGSIGAEVVYQVSGLLNYKEKLKCYLNETEVQVIEVTDSNIKVKVPAGASSGGMTIIIDGQIFFGPEFTITGKVGIDPTFKATVGSNGTINQILPLPNGNMLLVGGFTDFEKKASLKAPVNAIVLTSADGEFLPTLAAGAGAGGSLTSVLRLSNGQFMVAGTFTSYNKRKSIGGITRLNANGSLDSAIVEVVNLTPLEPRNSYDTVAAYNGAVQGTINKIFNYKDKLIAIGGFMNYYQYFYERSTRDNKVIFPTKMESLLQLKPNGQLDSTYNFSLASGTSYERPNGFFNDAVMLEDGKIVVVGSFTRFQGKPVNYIARIDNNGLIDPDFQVGSGADGAIESIRYNATTGKFMVSGSFRNFNGKPANGLVMLNKNGSVDESFKLGTLEGGNTSFVAQLSNGLILVTGSFTKYNGVVRQGFMILNGNGSLAEGYNNTGMFSGVIRDIYETTSPLGFPAVVMVGYINKFDNKSVGNIVRFTLRP